MEPTDRVALPAPPPRVWFGSFEWAVIPVQSNHRALKGAEGITYYDEAERHGERYTIYYAVDRGARETFDTIWHEWTHALNYAHDLKLKSTSPRRNDETLCTKHGHAWTQALLDNPALLQWLDIATNYIKSQQETIAE